MHLRGRTPEAVAEGKEICTEGGKPKVVDDSVDSKPKVITEGVRECRTTL